MHVAFFALITLFGVTASHAQQKVGYVDSEYILTRTPEYVTVQQQLDRTADEWNSELTKLGQELDQKFKDYQARELLYTNEERQRRRKEITSAEEDLENQRAAYFGPEGEIFTQQEQLMRPIQERVLTAIEEVAIQEGFDYIFDKSGDFLFLYARDQWDMSDKVLEELGIEVTAQPNRQRARN
ncbi:MAG: OmpH family outer membrane protein [Rhodothermia bacterium]|nr:MAG: OmpH family outer membrane protein [Rhodothermia bacterium]